ncbi:hypothetical protein CAPTEDRAFT_192800 [Capitella teleta]|uniref:G-protein coupled receptors family 1 profile domain-containing protein n=1 Tax=Capitella teleta TaxID=283909 RepID=R7V479_CAPTE|nr:hypothetical protein CAPTEDRAFT_192800 [Capitella teleta]|eukprot:ELU11151.1 hypothetical protein CAPTEDRAFT_192800 [Capitella teleta]
MGFRGKWNFFAFQCPKGSNAVGEFWRFIDDKHIQNIVLLEDISSKVLPAAGGSMLGSTKVICKEEWQKNGIKKFTATINKGKHQEEGVYVNQRNGINVLVVDYELTNKVIINTRKNLILTGRSPKCAIMCKDGKQLSGFFISVQIMLDMVDAGNDIDVLYSMNQFKAVCPDFAPSEPRYTTSKHLSHTEQRIRLRCGPCEQKLNFEPINDENLVRVMSRSATKQCELDPMPTHLVNTAHKIFRLIIIESDHGQCVAPKHYRHIYVALHIYMYQLVLQFMLPAILILACNLSILVKIRRLRVSSLRMNGNMHQMSQQAYGKRHHKTTCMLLIVSFTYVLTLLPLIVLSLLMHISVITNQSLATYLVVKLNDVRMLFELISEVNYAINFYIYVLSGAQFRYALRHICSRRYSFISSPAPTEKVFQFRKSASHS